MPEELAQKPRVPNPKCVHLWVVQVNPEVDATLAHFVKENAEVFCANCKIKYVQ